MIVRVSRLLNLYFKVWLLQVCKFLINKRLILLSFFFFLYFVEHFLTLLNHVWIILNELCFLLHSNLQVKHLLHALEILTPFLANLEALFQGVHLRSFLCKDFIHGLFKELVKLKYKLMMLDLKLRDQARLIVSELGYETMKQLLSRS